MSVRNKTGILIVMLLIPLQVMAKEAMLSMVYTNALDKELPYAIFTKNNWSPDPKAQYVKLHLYFDAPIEVTGLEIDSCGVPLYPNLSFFVNFDQWMLRMNPDENDKRPPARMTPDLKEDKLVFNTDIPLKVRTLTFNFEGNSGFKLCGIKLKDEKGDAYNIKTPVTITGEVSATSTLEPRSAYDPINLFDSRFEFGWASNHQEKNVRLNFQFEKTQRVESIRIWNGYQRSVKHCYSNSRAKSIQVTGDGGYRADIQIKDVLGSQVVTLPKPFEGKKLQFEVLDSFPGNSYQDLVISELRFYNGKDWFMLDSTKHMKQAIQSNRMQFNKAGLSKLLNKSFYAERVITSENAAQYGKQPHEQSYVSVVMRLRADGSFYLSGVSDHSDSGGIDGTSYFTLGNYEIREAIAGGLKIRLFGLYYESAEYGDCNGCGRDCNKQEVGVDDIEQKIFQEVIVIKPTKNGKIDVFNQSGGKIIKFDRLILSREDQDSDP